MNRTLTSPDSVASPSLQPAKFSVACISPGRTHAAESRWHFRQGLHQGRVGPRPSFFRIKPENTGRVGAAEKDKPEKTGRVGAAKKDKPEKTGRVGSAEIGGKTGSGRVRVGVDPTLVEPLNRAIQL